MRGKQPSLDSEPHFEKQTGGSECLLWPSLRQIDDLQSGFVIALFALAALESGTLITAPDVYSARAQSHAYTHLQERMARSQSPFLTVVLHCVASKHPPLALIIAAGEVLLRHYFISLMIASCHLLAPGARRAGRLLLLSCSEEVQL